MCVCVCVCVYIYIYMYSYIYRFFPDIYPLDDAEEDLDIDMPPLRPSLVQLFGHDSLGEWAGVPNTIVNQEVDVQKLFEQQEKVKMQQQSLDTPLRISLEQQLQIQRQNHEQLLQQQYASLQMYPQQQQHHQGGGGYIDSMPQEQYADGSTFLQSGNASLQRYPDAWVSDEDLGLAFRTSQPLARNPSLSMAPAPRANTQSFSWTQHVSNPYAGV